MATVKLNISAFDDAAWKISDARSCVLSQHSQIDNLTITLSKYAGDKDVAAATAYLTRQRQFSQGDYDCLSSLITQLLALGKFAVARDEDVMRYINASLKDYVSELSVWNQVQGGILTSFSFVADRSAILDDLYVLRTSLNTTYKGLVDDFFNFFDYREGQYILGFFKDVKEHVDALKLYALVSLSPIIMFAARDFLEWKIDDSIVALQYSADSLDLYLQGIYGEASFLKRIDRTSDLIEMTDYGDMAANEAADRNAKCMDVCADLVSIALGVLKEAAKAFVKGGATLEDIADVVMDVVIGIIKVFFEDFSLTDIFFDITREVLDGSIPKDMIDFIVQKMEQKMNESSVGARQNLTGGATPPRFDNCATAYMQQEAMADFLGAVQPVAQGASASMSQAHMKSATLVGASACTLALGFMADTGAGYDRDWMDMTYQTPLAGARPAAAWERMCDMALAMETEMCDFSDRLRVPFTGLMGLIADMIIRTDQRSPLTIA